MKTLSQLFESKKVMNFNVNKDALNYISEDDLKTYLDVAKPFLSEDSRNVINYLIVNNTSYISDLSTDDEENALAGFYNAGKPKSGNLGELWTSLHNVIKGGRPLEIPVFQTKEQFESIIKKEVAADEVILDLKTEAGRNKVVKQYEPLIHKIVNQWKGKSNLQYDDLYSAALVGFTYAMNRYGKRNKSEVADDAIKRYTFGQYAAQFMKVQILEAIKNESQTVRIPTSVQNKERKEKGSNTKNNSVSGDKAVGKDDEGGKSLFDFMGNVDDASKSLDQADLKRLWDAFYKDLEDEFDSKMLDIFYSFYGLRDHKKIQNKEIAEKYKVNPSNITYYISKIRRFIATNKKTRNKLQDCMELMKECQNDLDREIQGWENPVHVKITENTAVPE